MAIREGAWDCPACGRKRNRGPEKHCAGCGHPRGPEVEFYLPDDAEEVADAGALEKAEAGPDWICPYCGGDNAASYSHCTGCGAARDGAEERPVVEHREEPAKPPEPPAAAEESGEKPPRPRAKGKKKGCGRLGCLGLLVLAALAFFFLRPKDTTVTATSFAWERAVEVEALVTATEEAWEDEVPAGAEVLRRWQEADDTERVQTGTEIRTRTVTERVQTGTEKVKVGVRDLGNGYFEDIYEDRPVYEMVEREETYEAPVYSEEPVMRARVRYRIDRWQKERTERAQGQGRSPFWPPVRPGPREREGERSESYTVTFTDLEGRSVLFTTTDEGGWRRIEPGHSYRAKVSGGKVRRVGEEVAAESGP